MQIGFFRGSEPALDRGRVASRDISSQVECNLQAWKSSEGNQYRFAEVYGLRSNVGALTSGTQCQRPTDSQSDRDALAKERSAIGNLVGASYVLESGSS